MSKNVEIKGLKKVNDKIVGMKTRGMNLYPPLNAAGYIISRSVRKNIREQGRPRWNKPSARVRATGGKTLIKSTDLIKSIHSRVQGNTAITGTRKRYAAIHHYGGVIRAQNVPYLCFRIAGKFVKVKSVKIPKRQYMMIQKEDITKILKVFDDYIVRGRV